MQHPPSRSGSEGSPARPGVRYIEVTAEEAGQRIDNYLARTLKGVPRSRLYRILRKGEVRVNRARVKPDYRLRAGDSVRIPPVSTGAHAPVDTASAIHTGQGIEASIVFEDGRLIVVDKPSGVAVHGGSGISFGVIEGLRALRPSAPYLELVHRLDRETSGCLMIAKKRSALRTLHALLREGRVEKRYLALVAGRWALGARTVHAPLATAHRRRGERHVAVSESGKEASSVFKPVSFFHEATLMDVRTLTGRTHQIRVHASHTGHPLAGDDRYGDPVFNRRMVDRGLRRLFLHAHSVSFEWLDSGEPFHASAPLPADLAKVVDALEAPPR